MLAPTLSLLLASTGWLGASTEPVPAASAAPSVSGVPDVVVFVLDDVSSLDLPGLPLPNLDSLARKGMRFDRAYGMPVCHPARRSLLSGTVWPKRDGSIPCDPGPGPGPQVGDLPLAQMFDDAGYQTAGFGKWHLGEDPLGRPWPLAPFAHGFQHWKAGVPGNVDNCGGRNYRRWARMEEGTTFLENAYQTSELVASFRSWWPRVRGPRFAYVAFQAAHEPFHRPPPELLPPDYPPTPDTRSQFEAMIVSADTALGQMMADIDLERTFVVLIADNGTPEDVAPDPLKAKTTTFERGILVPMIVAGPGVAHGVCSSLVHIVDIFATLQELCGLVAPPPTWHARDGISFAPCLRDPAARTRDYVYVQLDDSAVSALPDFAVVSSRFKLREVGGVQTLYDLRADPLEEHPLPLDDPAYRKELRILRGWLETNRR